MLWATQLNLVYLFIVRKLSTGRPPPLKGLGLLLLAGCLTATPIGAAFAFPAAPQPALLSESEDETRPRANVKCKPHL